MPVRTGVSAVFSILLAAALGLWAVGFLLVRRLRGCAINDGTPSGAVSVVIPARNEAHNLPTLLQSLAAQETRPHEIIVVDDASTDGTAGIAREHGAKVVSSQPLPEGWRGKTWACHQGAQAATGNLLLFLDADTWFESGGFQCALSAYTAGAFSVGPYHAVQRPYEQLSLFFNLNMAAGTAPDALFGPMLLVDRVSYWQVGGHEAVRGKVLENLQMAGRFRAAGVPVRSALGRGALSFRMYPQGLGDLIEGWTKGFASGAGQTPRGVLILIIAWMIGLMLTPSACGLAEDRMPWFALYGLCVVQVGWLARRVGAFGWATALLYPVPLLFFFAVFARSLTRSGRTVNWKGRQIRAD